MSSIDTLRRAAKSLKSAFRKGDADAHARVAAVLGARDTLTHTDALHVIARELGEKSWPRLKVRVETAAADRTARAERLKIALFHGHNWVVDTLLDADPTLADAHLGLQVALYRMDAVEDALRKDPDAATRAIGPRRPILHLAFSQHWRRAGAEASVAMAELLLAHGADVNDSYPWQPGEEHCLSALYGALGHAGNLALAEWLLEHGATPDDNESLYHATELPTLDGVRLLLQHGVTIDGTNALPRMLDFENPEGVRLLLEAGADPNEGAKPHPSGETPVVIPSLHQAARRMRSGEVAQILIEYGADGTRPHHGHTAYAYARMRGNRDVAAVLEQAGQATPLDAVEAALAAAADGQPTSRIDPSALSDETRRILTRVLGAEHPLAHVQRLVAAGINPDWTDEQDMPAIHIAGWEGHADAVRWLLGFSPDLVRKNMYGGDLLGTVIHGAEFCPARDRRDHIGCAQAVLEAGSTLHRADIDGCGIEALVSVLEDWAASHPDCVVDRG